MNETITVDTYSMDSYTAGTNDQGEALHVLDGVEMTAAKRKNIKTTSVLIQRWIMQTPKVLTTTPCRRP